jgi:hypothetical protein
MIQFETHFTCLINSWSKISMKFQEMYSCIIDLTRLIAFIGVDNDNSVQDIK